MPYQDPPPYDCDGHRVEIKVHFLPEADKPQRAYWVAIIDGGQQPPQLSEELARRLAEEEIKRRGK